MGARSEGRAARRWRAADPLLVDPAGASSWGVLAASADDTQRAAHIHAGGVGSLLCVECRVATLEFPEGFARSTGVRAHLQALSPDVREDGNCHRQCPRAAFGGASA